MPWEMAMIHTQVALVTMALYISLGSRARPSDWLRRWYVPKSMYANVTRQTCDVSFGHSLGNVHVQLLCLIII